MTYREVLRKALEKGYKYYRDKGTIATPIQEVLTWEHSDEDCWCLKDNQAREAILVRTDGKKQDYFPFVTK